MGTTFKQFTEQTKFAFIDVNSEDYHPYDREEIILNSFGISKDFEDSTQSIVIDDDKYETSKKLFQIFSIVKSSIITIEPNQIIWNIRLQHSTEYRDYISKNTIAEYLEEIFNFDTDIELYHTMDNGNLFITYIGYI